MEQFLIMLMVHYSLTTKEVIFYLHMKDCQWMFINCASSSRGPLHIPLQMEQIPIPLQSILSFVSSDFDHQCDRRRPPPRHHDFAAAFAKATVSK